MRKRRGLAQTEEQALRRAAREKPLYKKLKKSTNTSATTSRTRTRTRTRGKGAKDALPSTTREAVLAADNRYEADYYKEAEGPAPKMGALHSTKSRKKAAPDRSRPTASRKRISTTYNRKKSAKGSVIAPSMTEEYQSYMKGRLDESIPTPLMQDKHRSDYLDYEKNLHGKAHRPMIPTKQRKGATRDAQKSLERSLKPHKYRTAMSKIPSYDGIA